MKMDMAYKLLLTGLLCVVSLPVVCGSAWAMLVIDAQTTVEIELIGYNALADSSLFKGSVSAGEKYTIETPYRGLALLVFTEGQRYPVIIGEEPVSLKITGPGAPPSFADNSENDLFYKVLSSGVSGPEQDTFALLMIQAKQLLESSHSIRTTRELTAKKKEFHAFVGKHYQRLKHSDMVKRLIGQYFMMHEYVGYHGKGDPATDIRMKYQGAVLNGVGSWLQILQSHIPEYEILNYCVSLYYNRSMVSLASLIIENFQSAAYCPGVEQKIFSFPEDLLLTEASGNGERRLKELKGKKIIAFASDECPVSMVETIIKAREMIDQGNDGVMIVAPLQKLSEKYLAMRRMVSGGSMFFVNDEKWRKKNLTRKIKLPYITSTGGALD